MATRTTTATQRLAELRRNAAEAQAAIRAVEDAQRRGEADAARLRDEIVSAYADGADDAADALTAKMTALEADREQLAVRADGARLAARRAQNAAGSFARDAVEELLAERADAAEQARADLVDVITGVETAVAAWNGVAAEISNLLRAGDRPDLLRAMPSLPGPVDYAANQVARLDVTAIAVPMPRRDVPGATDSLPSNPRVAL